MNKKSTLFLSTLITAMIGAWLNPAHAVINTKRQAGITCRPANGSISGDNTEWGHVMLNSGELTVLPTGGSINVICPYTDDHSFDKSTVKRVNVHGSLGDEGFGPNLGRMCRKAWNAVGGACSSWVAPSEDAASGTYTLSFQSPGNIWVGNGDFAYVFVAQTYTGVTIKGIWSSQ